MKMPLSSLTQSFHPLKVAYLCLQILQMYAWLQLFEHNVELEGRIPFSCINTILKMKKHGTNSLFISSQKGNQFLNIRFRRSKRENKIRLITLFSEQKPIYAPYLRISLEIYIQIDYRIYIAWTLWTHTGFTVKVFLHQL